MLYAFSYFAGEGRTYGSTLLIGNWTQTKLSSKLSLLIIIETLPVNCICTEIKGKVHYVNLDKQNSRIKQTGKIDENGQRMRWYF